VNQQFTATCQCIIAHPSKPKFLAIRHSNGFLPPQISVPDDAILGTHVQQVLDGISNKYGLRVTLLRHLASFRDYHCVELEMHGKDARKMEAIWVGLDDYKRMRGTERFDYDPLAAWLQEKEGGDVPSLRPAWEQAGWFDQAVHWIQFQLDRLNVQVTGSVTQHRALLHSATLLRVPTAVGQVYFKAAYRKRPAESRLNALLAEYWPQWTPNMLAADHQRNWMLLPDYAPGSEQPFTPEGLASAAAAMGEIQLDSVGRIPQFQAQGCPQQGMSALQEFLAQPGLEQRVPVLPEGGLSKAERDDLERAARSLAGVCRQLTDCGIPDTLVHPDFRAANFFVGADSVRIIDWADACLAPPYFSLLELMRENRPRAFTNPAEDPVVRAWLAPLCRGWDEAPLLRGLSLAIRLQHAWRLMRWIQEFSWLEAGSVAEQNAWRFVTSLSRQMIAGEAAA